MIVRPDPTAPPPVPEKAPPPPRAEWGQRAIILASGPSALGFKPPPDVPVIAVNGAIDLIEHPAFFHTTDWSPVNLHRLRTQRSGTIYTAAYPKHRQTIHDVWYFARGEEGKTPPHHVKVGSPEWRVWRWVVQLGLSEDPHVINVGNSAYGALGLAYHLGFRHVATLGVDCAPPYTRIEGGTSGDLSHVPVMFASARRFISITSCGHMRAVGIPNTTLGQWLEETPG